MIFWRMGSVGRCVLITVVVCLLTIEPVHCQSIDHPPENTASLIETPAHLNCTVTLNGDVIQWFHHLDEQDEGGTQIYPPPGGQMDDRFDVIVDEDAGVYDLVVKDVRQSVAGTYDCKLPYSDQIDSGEVVALKKLMCFPLPGTQELEEGQLAGLTCETEVYGYKKPKLEWSSAGYRRVMNQYFDETRNDEEPEEEDHIVRQVANFSVTPEHNEVVFECYLKFDKDTEEEDAPPTYTDQCATFFYVLHPPDPAKIELYPEPSDYPDNITVVRVGDWINCSASARPEPFYEWKNDDDTEYTPGPILEITWDMMPAEGQPTEKKYRCIVSNVINGQPQYAEREFMFRIGAMVILDQDTGASYLLTGTYRAGLDLGWYPVHGQRAQTQDTFGFTMIGEFGETATSFTGQCYGCTPDTLYTSVVTYHLDNDSCTRVNHVHKMVANMEQQIFYRED